MKYIKYFICFFVILSLSSCFLLPDFPRSFLIDDDNGQIKLVSSTVYVKVNGQYSFTPKYIKNKVEYSAKFEYKVEPSSLGYFSGNTFHANSIVESGNVTISLADNSSVYANCKVVVYNSDDSYIDTPFKYNNQLYYGATKGTGSVKSNSDLQIEYPKYKAFDADGFFHFKGKSVNSSCYDYFYVTITHAESNLVSQYFLRGDFDTNIWLRFGSGTYNVKVSTLSNITVTLDGEGWISSWSYRSFDTYTVTNINNENGRYIYPSNMVQSDAPEIQSIVASCVNSSDSDTQKAQNLHDYIINLCSYDNDSLVDGHRKKQDALSTYKNKKGVCEGYADLTAALFRAAGLECCVIEGTGVTSTGGGGHAWNKVKIDGKWKFIDTTWDDTAKTTKYFLLDSMSGINNDHIESNPQDKSYSGRSDQEYDDKIILSNM